MTDNSPSEFQSSDYHLIQGAWKAIYIQRDGVATEGISGAIEAYEGITYYWILPEHELKSNSFDFRLDSSASPKHIDIASPEGTLYGIYALVDDILVTCFPGNDGEPRPEGFRSNSNLTVLRRVVQTLTII